MGEWKGLPDSIPSEYLDFYLFINGNVFITDKNVDNKLCIYTGGLGGFPDQLFRPTIYTVSNPAQKLSKNFVIEYEDNEGDGILIKNDFLMKGVVPLISKYAVLLSENELSIWDAEINTRIISVLSAADSKTKQALDEYIEKILSGDLSVVFEKTFGEDSIKSTQFTNTSACSITDLIELEQYLKGSLFNEIGLQSNWNAKRESISSNESQLNEDMLMPFIDQMLYSRNKACEQINKKYGLNVSYELSSVWEDNQEQIDAELEAISEGKVTSDESSMEDSINDVKVEDNEQNK